MRTRIRKWGNSLAVRIPKPFAEQAGLAENLPIDLRLMEGRLLIEPLVESNMALTELLAGITDDNCHREIETGAPVGTEVW
ncbi:MAG: AbrB/MazE/SpoVT family DNA-binding domain-containing protein [Chloroflexota bacterium]